MRAEMITLLTILLLAAPVMAVDSNDALLEELADDTGWERAGELDNDRVLRTKIIDGLDLGAVEVAAELSLRPDTIIEVVEAVDRYNNIITSNEAMTCYQITENDTHIVGYQYYKVPLMTNRYVVFHMDRAYTDDRGRIRSDWKLMDGAARYPDQLEQWHDGENPVQLERGAGTWVIEPLEDDRWRVAYRLYMNPGGWLPGFVLDRVNRSGINGLFDDVIREANRLAEKTADNPAKQIVSE